MKFNKRKWAIVGTIVLWIGIISYLVVTIAFVKDKRKDIVCRKVDVIIADSLSNRFVNKDDIILMANKEVSQLIGTRISKINTHKIEQRLHKLDLLRSAEVYTTVSGVLTIKVEQRDAIMRIYNADGTSSYIDEEGYIIPLSARYAANVVVVNGNISLKKTTNGRVRIVGNLKDSSQRKGLLYQLFDFVNYIKKDGFWNSQIVQIYVKSPQDIELTTRVGNHVIEMGSLDEYDKKLKKLLAFYNNALPVEGWNKYGTINLKYENQVICKK